jgi:DNA gyrase subunit B
VNNINTHEGGTHLTGFKSALTRTINDVAKRRDFLKKEGFTLRARTSARASPACCM